MKHSYIIADLAAMAGILMISRGLYLWHEIAMWTVTGGLLIIYGFVAMLRHIPKEKRETHVP